MDHARIGLFGSEGHGLDPAIITLCNRRLTIPMHAEADSLNVAVAAGIFLYRFQNRRTSGNPQK